MELTKRISELWPLSIKVKKIDWPMLAVFIGSAIIALSLTFLFQYIGVNLF